MKQLLEIDYSKFVKSRYKFSGFPTSQISPTRKMSYNYSKKIISAIPFSKEFLADEKNIESLKANSSWIIGAAQALINKEFNLIRNSSGLIDPEASLAAFIEKHTLEERVWFQNLIKYLTIEKRSEIVLDAQTKVPNYSALVPLFLAPFKMYRDVGYSEWDWANPLMKLFVDPYLLDACTILTDLKPSLEEKIAAREYSRLIKSGIKKGQVKSLTSTTSISSKAFEHNIEYNELPRLRKIMECQVWVAHPSLRTKYMILDVNDMDNMPEPLDQEEFIIPKAGRKPRVISSSDELDTLWVTK